MRKVAAIVVVLAVAGAVLGVALSSGAGADATEQSSADSTYAAPPGEEYGPGEREEEASRHYSTPPERDFWTYEPPAEGITPEPGSGEVVRVTEDYGIIADVTNCSVVIEGKPLEGQKLLLPLGKCLFINEHLVYPAKARTAGVQKWVFFSSHFSKELELLYGLMVAEEGKTNREALRAMADFAAAIPLVEFVAVSSAAPGRGGIITTWAPKPDLPIGGNFSLRTAQGRVEKYRSQRRNREIKETFREILTQLRAGKALHIEEGRDYQIVAE